LACGDVELGIVRRATSRRATASTTFDAYGNKTGSTATTTTPLSHDGQYTSTDTGLIYLRARAHDPATAQFLSVDPVLVITTKCSSRRAEISFTCRLKCLAPGDRPKAILVCGSPLELLERLLWHSASGRS